jgi:UDP-N-acetylmuramate--alanine ligase
MRINIFDKFYSFYFVGIGGVSMSGLAKYLVSIGKRVGGSDRVENGYTAELDKLGVRIERGGCAGKIGEYDVVIYTDAIRDDDIQLLLARQLEKVVLSRGQFLYEVSRNFKKVIAICGCHGKTTCTSMLAHIFASAGKKFTAHIGGKDLTFSNFFYSGNDFFITEACEYKKNFLLLKPDIAVVLNSDPDHLECYSSVAELKENYIHFADSADIAISLFCDIDNEKYISFGFDKRAKYHSSSVRCIGGKYSFCVNEGEYSLGKVTLNVYGKHNILNALAAIAVARTVGIPFDLIKDGLAGFQGVERRFESLGNFRGVPCIADYAHHPSEIRATIRAVKKITNGKIFVVFQPHTYSRTKNLFNDFVKVLSSLNNLLIYRTFAAREYFDDGGSAFTLSRSIKKSRYGDNVRDIINFLLRAQSGDLILFLGAGDIYDIAKSIVKCDT